METPKDKDKENVQPLTRSTKRKRLTKNDYEENCNKLQVASALTFGKCLLLLGIASFAYSAEDFFLIFRTIRRGEVEFDSFTETSITLILTPWPFNEALFDRLNLDAKVLSVKAVESVPVKVTIEVPQDVKLITSIAMKPHVPEVYEEDGEKKVQAEVVFQFKKVSPLKPEKFQHATE